MRYTLPELEGLSVALNENNKTDTDDSNTFVDSDYQVGTLSAYLQELHVTG